MRTVVAVVEAYISFADENPRRGRTLSAFPVIYIRGMALSARVLYACRPAFARIDYMPVAQMRGLGRHNVGTGAAAGIYEAGLHQASEFPFVYISAPALAIAASVRIDASFVPVQSEPVQVVLYQPGIFVAAASRVQVFYAQQPLPAAAFRREPGKQGAEHISQMHPSAGGGGKAAFCRFHFFSQIRACKYTNFSSNLPQLGSVRQKYPLLRPSGAPADRFQAFP